MNPLDLSLAEQLAYSTVRIQCDRADGSSSIGTGFFFNFASNNIAAVPSIVTNRHVVQGSTSGRFCLTVQGGDGGPIIGHTTEIAIDAFEQKWISHPSPEVDLCAMPIAPLIRDAELKRQPLFLRAFSIDQIATSADLGALDQIEDVTMIGYPNGLWDQTNNMPLFRRGATATHPGRDWNGKPEFMIDAASFPGSSGSPVVLFNAGSFHDKRNITFMATRLQLVGVLYALYQYVASGEMVVVPVPTANTPIVQTGIPLHLGLVIKATELMALDTHFGRLRVQAANDGVDIPWVEPLRHRFAIG